MQSGKKSKWASTHELFFLLQSQINMSIESFFESHPADKDLYYKLLHEEEFHQDHSDARALADLSVRKGREGLLVLGKSLVNEKNPIQRDGKTIIPTTESETKAILINKAAIMWGALFPTIEDIIVNRAYDPVTFLTRYREGLLGTRWANPSLNVLNNQLGVEPVDLDQVERIRQVAQYEDRSLSYFMTPQGMGLLPLSLQYTVEKSGVWDYMSTVFYDRYRKIADILCPTPALPAVDSSQSQAETPTVRTDPMRVRHLTFD